MGATNSVAAKAAVATVVFYRDLDEVFDVRTPKSPRGEVLRGVRQASRASMPNCDNSASATAKSCAECGQPLELALGLRVKGRVDTPQSLTPKHLVERVLIWKNAMKGERKQVTVLFAEVKGSMELLADHDPEETMKLLDPILAHMMAAVHQYERPVNQVMGGGVSAWPIKASDGTRAALGVRQTQWRSLWPPPRSPAPRAGRLRPAASVTDEPNRKTIFDGYIATGHEARSAWIDVGIKADASGAQARRVGARERNARRSPREVFTL